VIFGVALLLISTVVLFLRYKSTLGYCQSLKEQTSIAEQKADDLVRVLEDERVAKRVLEHELEVLRGLEKRTKELIDQTRQQLFDRFEAASHDAFSRSQRTFFDLAKQTFDQYSTLMNTSMNKKQEEAASLLSPLKTTLEQMEKKVHELEIARKGAYEGLHQQLHHLSTAHSQLQKETGSLAKALREPVVRGRWGEIQLRRVVEVAGMLSYCDFDEQVSTGSDLGCVRPDMVVRLPNDRAVVIDAKVSLNAYLDAIDAEDEQVRKERLLQHAKCVRQHVTRLSQKKYWDQFSRTPDFVVLFLPGECFLSPAFEYDKELLEYAGSQKVLLATPTSLIAMLKVIAYSWGEAKVEQHAHLIVQEARAWLERCKIFSEHFSDIGRHLERSVKAYDRAVGSFENRLLVSVRRLAASGIQSSEVDLPPTLRLIPMSMQHERADVSDSVKGHTYD